MTRLAHRRAFLSGRPVERLLPVRPPWSLEDLEDRCNGCGACAAACPERLIRLGRGRLPELDFSRSACNLCGACRSACTAGLLSAARPWQARLIVEPHCLARQGVVCRSCADACEAGALHFRLAPGGRSGPTIDPAACTGCGACVAPCPVAAIRVLNRPTSHCEEPMS